MPDALAMLVSPGGYAILLFLGSCCALGAAIESVNACNTAQSSKIGTRTAAKCGDFSIASLSRRNSASFKKSLVRAEKGDVRSQYAVGKAYVEGIGVLRDYRKAAGWFERAAAKSISARQKLGELHAGGQLGSKNPSMAYAWFLLAGAVADEQRKKLASQISSGEKRQGEDWAKQWQVDHTNVGTWTE